MTALLAIPSPDCSSSTTASLPLIFVLVPSSDSIVSSISRTSAVTFGSASWELSPGSVIIGTGSGAGIVATWVDVSCDDFSCDEDSAAAISALASAADVSSDVIKVSLFSAN